MLPPTDGPGKRTFTTEPGGAIVFMQPYVPALRGIAVSLTWRNALHVADTVTPNVALTGPRACGSEPV